MAKDSKSKTNENSIEVIFDKYEEVKLNQNGFTVTFENKADVLFRGAEAVLNKENPTFDLGER